MTGPSRELIAHRGLERPGYISQPVSESVGIARGPFYYYIFGCSFAMPSPNSRDPSAEAGMRGGRSQMWSSQGMEDQIAAFRYQIRSSFVGQRVWPESLLRSRRRKSQKIVEKVLSGECELPDSRDVRVAAAKHSKARLYSEDKADDQDRKEKKKKYTEDIILRTGRRGRKDCLIKDWNERREEEGIQGRSAWRGAEGKGGVEAARRVATVERWLWRVWATSQYRILVPTFVQLDQSRPEIQPPRFSSRPLIVSRSLVAERIF
ncbi:hypothetical protein BDW67DRAFT_50744 [Aspergillus spinulosporus]